MAGKECVCAYMCYVCVCVCVYVMCVCECVCYVCVLCVCVRVCAYVCVKRVTMSAEKDDHECREG